MSFIKELQEASLNSLENKYLSIKEELLEMVIANPMQKQYVLYPDSSVNPQSLSWICDRLREEGVNVDLHVGVLSDLSIIITGLDKLDNVENC